MEIKSFEEKINSLDALAKNAGKKAAEQAVEQPSQQERLESFQSEIQAIKDGEMAKKAKWEERGRTGEAYDPHFNDINPDYLGDFERSVYEKYKSNDLSEEEFGQLRSETAEKYKEIPADDEKYQTLRNFWAYLGNLINIRNARRKIEEIRKRKE